jgi:hypothetical protein
MGTDFVDAVVVDRGTPLGGLADMQANDNVFYLLKGTATVPRETQWRARFTNVPATLTNLRFSLRDKVSPACTRTVEILNVLTGTWTLLDQRLLGAAETNLTLIPPGPASQYVDAGGVMTVRLSTVLNGTLQRHRTDVLLAQYDS